MREWAALGGDWGGFERLAGARGHAGINQPGLQRLERAEDVDLAAGFGHQLELALRGSLTAPLSLGFPPERELAAAVVELPVRYAGRDLRGLFLREVDSLEAERSHQTNSFVARATVREFTAHLRAVLVHAAEACGFDEVLTGVPRLRFVVLVDANQHLGDEDDVAVARPWLAGERASARFEIYLADSFPACGCQ